MVDWIRVSLIFIHRAMFYEEKMATDENINIMRKREATII